MHVFDFVLVDSRYPSFQSLDVLELAWKHNPLTIGALFNLYGPVAQEWQTERFLALETHAPDRSG